MSCTNVIIDRYFSKGDGVSLLDRLKREGDQQRALQEVVTRERDTRDALYKNEIEPRMKALVTYLEALVATLNEVRPLVVVKMPIAGYGDLGAQPIWDFRIDHDRRYRNFVVTMDWTLRVDPEHTPIVRAEGVTKIKTLTAAFHKFHLGGVKEEKRNKSGELLIASFHARGHIKARLEAKVSADDPVLRMVLSNVSWLGSSQRQFSWQQIDDDLADRIARFVVREDDTLFTEELGSSLRQQLKKESEADAFAAELGFAEPMAQAQPSEVPVVVEASAATQAQVDVGGSAVADILAQLDPNTVPKEELTRLTEPDAPDLPSLEELNAAFRATPAKRLEVMPLGVPGAPTEPEPEAETAFVERRAPMIAAHAAELAASVAVDIVSAPAPAAARTESTVTVAPALPQVVVAPPELKVPAAVNGAGMNAPAPLPPSDPAKPSLFMSRMSETLRRLRDDEEDGT